VRPVVLLCKHIQSMHFERCTVSFNTIVPYIGHRTACLWHDKSQLNAQFRASPGREKLWPAILLQTIRSLSRALAIYSPIHIQELYLWSNPFGHTWPSKSTRDAWQSQERSFQAPFKHNCVFNTVSQFKLFIDDRLATDGFHDNKLVWLSLCHQTDQSNARWQTGLT